MKKKRKEYIKAWYEKNKEKKIEYNRRYKQENKEKIAERKKQYCQENKEKIAERSKRYYQENKEKIDERSKRYRKQYYQTKQGKAYAQSNAYKHYDEARGFDASNNITADWIIENIFSGQSCVYCGDSDWTHLGADRIDNDKPHTPDNVVCSCMGCNRKRGNRYTVQEFKALMENKKIMVD